MSHFDREAHLYRTVLAADDTAQGSLSSGETAKADKPTRSPKSHRRLTLGIGAAAAVAAVGVFGYHEVQARNDKVAAYTAKEAKIIEYQRKHPSPCLNRDVLLRSGVTYRTTPDSIDSKLVILQGNKAGEVGSGQELPAKQPHWYVDAHKNIWLAFTQGESTAKPGGFVSSEEIAKETDWVNYSKLQNATNNQGLPLVENFKLAGAPRKEFIGCTISDHGQTLSANGQPAAYAVAAGAGQFEMFRAVSGLDPAK